MKIRQILSLFCMWALAAYVASPLVAAPPVVMKILVITGSSSENGYLSITAILNQIGVPYQSLVLNTTAKDASGNRLSKIAFSDTTTGNGLYQGIILTDSTFAACNSSCLSTADWNTLNTYAAQFHVRVVSYYTLPQAQWGLVAADSGVNYTSSKPLNVSLTPDGTAIFSYLNTKNPIPVGGQGSNTIKAYRATTTAATNETTVPLLTSGGYTVAALHTTADGREAMALTMDNAPGLLHSEAFGYGIVTWVTKGVFIGARRVYLNPQIDDMLLGNRLYAPTLPQCPADDSCPTLYATAQDLQALVSWQNNLKADPLFSTFHSTYGLNGVGTTWFPKTDPVFAAIASLGSNFTWVSHTWDHPNLDCYTVNSNGACVPATVAQSLSELNQNISVAPSLGITLDRTGMITPFGSGLTNANFMAAAAQVGIQYIMSSAPPADPQTGVVSPVNSAIYQIPRVAPNLFDDVSVPQTGVYGSWPDEYNATFGPNGKQPIYSQDQTYAQILDHESDAILLNEMLTYDPCLLAFHIDNSSAYDGMHSMYSDLLDATIAKYKNVFALPVLTLDMKELASMFINRTSIKTSGVTGVYTPGVSVVLTTNKAATIPITGACSQDTCGLYGGQIQDNVVMAANSSVTLTLTANEGVTLSSLSLNPTSVTGGASATGTVTLSGAAPQGGVTVTLASNNASVTMPGTVAVAMGSTTATFTVTTTSVTSSSTTTITAGYGSGTKTATLTVNPASTVTLSSVTMAPTSVSSGTSATGTVVLSAAAPAGGVSVLLSSNNTSASVPASVNIAAGSTNATFVVSTAPVNSATAVTITATYQGVSKAAALTITPVSTAALSSIALNPASVTGGSSAKGTVTLTSAAPTGGVQVSLTSNSTSATVPASITVAAGSTTATFTITTKSVTVATSAIVTGAYNGSSQTAMLSITPASAKVALSTVLVNPATVTGGQTSTGTVTLTAAAPSGGLSVELWTTGTAAFVPANINFAAGSTSATFNITTNQAGSNLQDTVTAFYNGTTKTAKITVNKAF